MGAFWITFDGHKSACMEAPTEADAIHDAEEITGAKVKTCKILPYPATPRLRPYADPKYGVCPAFCYRPEQCAGRTCCPQNHSCTE